MIKPERAMSAEGWLERLHKVAVRFSRRGTGATFVKLSVRVTARRAEDVHALIKSLGV